MKLLAVYRTLILLLVACIFGMGAALKHAQHRADRLHAGMIEEMEDRQRSRAVAIDALEESGALRQEVARLKHANQTMERMLLGNAKSAPATRPFVRHLDGSLDSSKR